MKLKCFIVLINLQNKNTFPLMRGKIFRFLKGGGGEIQFVWKKYNPDFQQIRYTTF